MKNPGPIAEEYGGRALVGGDAESIREEKLSAMGRTGRLLACDPEGPCRAAGFWVKHQHKRGEDIQAYLIERRKLVAEVAAMKIRLEKFWILGHEDYLRFLSDPNLKKEIPIHDVPFELGILQGKLWSLTDEFEKPTIGD